MVRVRFDIQRQASIDVPVIYVSKGVAFDVERSEAMQLALFHHHIDA